jgi:hypothetical protein
MRHVRDEEWPRLGARCRDGARPSTDVVFFGSDRAMLDGRAAAVQAAGVAVERLPVGEARRRFPAAVRRRRGDPPRSAGGTIAAEQTVRALHRLVASAGGVVLEDTRA